MKKLVMGGLALSFLFPSSALAYRGDRGDCNREGNCNDQRKCEGSSGDCRGSFSPGPFDRSPVDIHNNQVCISPDCSTHNNGDQKKPPQQQPTGLAICAIPVPYHCDPKPSAQAYQF